MNIEILFLPKFCGGEIYPRFRKLQNEAKINTKHAQHKPNILISIKAAVAIWTEDK